MKFSGRLGKIKYALLITLLAWAVIGTGIGIVLLGQNHPTIVLISFITLISFVFGYVTAD